MPKTANDRIETLRNIPLFSYLKPEELQAVQGLFVEEVHRKGADICRAGDEGDSFYIVLSGELEVWGGDGDSRKLLSRLGPRDFFGELALVVGGPRSATVSVSRQARLLSLSKESFNRYFLKNTKALEYFSRVICQRLAIAARDEGVEGLGSKVVTVVAHPEMQGSTMVAATLACLLRKWTGESVLYARVHGDRARPGSVNPITSLAGAESGEFRRAYRPHRHLPVSLDLDLQGERATTPEGFAAMVSRLCVDFDYIVVDLGSGPRPVVETVADFSDVVVEVVRRRSEPLVMLDPGFRRFQVLDLYNRGTRRIPLNSCEPFVLPRDADLPAGLAPLALGERLRDAPLSPLGMPLHRLTRKILGRSVGLALGGGAAFGLAHLGVIQVLEDNGLPIDLVAGCSMGSLVAIGYCAGLSVQRLTELAAILGSKSKLLNLVRRDSTLLRPGFLSGDGIKETFEPQLGDARTFHHLLRPCRAVATDIETGERVDLGSGSLVDAFRASCSVPIVMAPVRRGKRVLVDGGVCDPVPAEVVRNMGADICLAVNVVPPMKKGVEMLPSRIYRRFNLFNPLAYLGESLDMPNLFDIFMNSMQTLQFELGNFKAISADVRINPDLSDFTWVDFFRDKELIERGAEAAERSLPAIKRAIAGVV
ncbi:MAG: patatin-like phospholipase family protein [Acidobacteriota bacterium]